MKKAILFTLSLVFVLSMMGCPATINRGPRFNRVVVVNGNDTLENVSSITADIYNAAKQRFLDKDQNEGLIYDYHEDFDESYLIYEYEKGSDFSPEDVVTSLVEDFHLVAIDYNQDYVEVGASRDYTDISDKILLTSFYTPIGLDDETPETTTDTEDTSVTTTEEIVSLYDSFEKDDDGNYIIQTDLIFVLQVLLPVGDVMQFKLEVEDEDGARIQITGVILIVEPSGDSN